MSILTSTKVDFRVKYIIIDRANHFKIISMPINQGDPTILDVYVFIDKASKYSIYKTDKIAEKKTNP